MSTEKYRRFYDEDGQFTHWVRNATLLLIFAAILLANGLAKEAIIAITLALVTILSSLLFWLLGPQRFSRVSRVFIFPIVVVLVIVISSFLLAESVNRL